MIVLRRLVVTVLLGLAMLAVGTLTGVPSDAAWAEAPGPLPLIAQGLFVTGSWAAENPQTAMIALGVVIVPILLGRLVAMIPGSIQKDPQRLYTSDQRRAGFAMADGRCEMEGFFLLTRCNAAAAHGDHWIPWSRGGATSMDNFVSACGSCNSSKGAKVPTFWQTQRLAWRRRKYFPSQANLTPGGKYVLPYR